MRRIGSAVAQLLVSSAVAFASPSGALGDCTTIFPAQSGWAVEMCATDVSPLVPMAVVVNGVPRGNAVGVLVSRASADPGHMPQVAVFTSDGYLRLKPVDRLNNQIQFGSSFVLGPAYWQGGDYKHHPQLTHFDINTSRLPAALDLNASGTNAALNVSYGMSLTSNAHETRLHVTQSALAQSDIAIDAGRTAEGEGYKPVQFSSMFITEGTPCFGGQYTNCNDANVVRFLAQDGSEVRIGLKDITPPSFVVTPTAPLKDQIVELLQTSGVTWQHGPTPNVRLLLDDAPSNFSVRGYVSPASDPAAGDNVGLWVQDNDRAATGFRAGDRATIGYTLVGGDSQLPMAQGFTWFSDGAFTKSGPVGTVVTAFGTGLRTNTAYLLVTVRHGDTDSPCAFDVVPVNNTVRFSNSRGFVPNTAGRLNRPPGVWDMCFYEADPIAGAQVAGLPVQFTVN